MREFISVTILVPKSDLYIDCYVKEEVEDSETPHSFDVDINEIELKTVNYEIVDYDLEAVDDLAIERFNDEH